MSYQVQFFGLACWLVVCLGAAVPGGWFGPGEWYVALRQPSWNPPNWIFAPVWTVLCTMMAVAAWCVWRRGGGAAQRRPLLVFLGQLAFNAAWTPLFFGLHWLGVALLEIIALWMAIGATMAAFGRVSRVVAWLLVPYWVWVGFASFLTLTLWRLNA